MRALRDMRGALTDEEHVVYQYAQQAALNAGGFRACGEIAGRRLAGLLSPLQKALDDLSPARGVFGEQTTHEYSRGFIDGWLDATFEDVDREEIARSCGPDIDWTTVPVPPWVAK